ncbi:TonB-dependent receptor [Sphingomonas sp.]|jgi:outer membrane receptor protein involved in Fe transport|uniref:TonB-dependent receptor n=1 Tax=Sphingomonas sp. TaxID=28214 RepID=UPI002E37BA61|nr:TonB-dependent receptor [Sphingomonas sp.]HEX4693167.1 TonB-dependent receptor [Sphingomonas sp.]
MRYLYLLSAAAAALIPAAAGAQDAPTPPATAANTPAPPPANNNQSGDIVVTASRLDHARDAILPSLGASDYTMDRTLLEKQPGGVDRNLVQVLVQVPGVTLDSYGAVHVRNEHANLQYRLNGVIVPESISGFGSTFDPRIADSIDLLTGTLPAQYGYRTSGVVSLKTRSGAFANGGDIGYYGGSRGTIEPSASVRGSSGGLNYFASGSYLQNDLGVENPISSRDAIHDRTRQYRGFGYLSDIVSESSRLTVFGGASIGYFQIPDNPGQPGAYTLNGVSSFDSARLDQNQREITYYGVLAYQYAGGPFNLQIAPFVRYSQTRFTPDPLGGDLILSGVADRSLLSSLTAGVQADGSYKLSDAHTLRFGIFFQNERTRSMVASRVFAVDANGGQTSDVPLSIIDTGGRDGQLYGIYLQDEWSLTPTLTLNYGARFDAVRAYTREQQVSPRVNLVWKPGDGTTFHLGYARNFTPPPQELIAAPTLALFAGTTKQTEIGAAGPVRAEREHYFDGGFQQTIARGFKIGVDAYYKIKRNLLDEGQFGPSLVLSPFNYAKGYAWGVELSANYTRKALDLYANVARGQEKGKAIVSSQYFFAPDELAYIANHYIFTDHSQRWTASGGASITIGDGIGKLVPTVDFLYGDGLRADEPAGIVPNGGKLPSYFTANFGIAQNLDGPGVLKGVSIRLDVTNVFDKVYLLRDGSGVGVGAPQYGARRGVFAGIRKTF